MGDLKDNTYLGNGGQALALQLASGSLAENQEKLAERNLPVAVFVHFRNLSTQKSGRWVRWLTETAAIVGTAYHGLETEVRLRVLQPLHHDLDFLQLQEAVLRGIVLPDERGMSGP